MKPQIPDPTPSDLHAINILIESAASEPRKEWLEILGKLYKGMEAKGQIQAADAEADAIARASVDQHLAERSDLTEISILWQRDADGRVFTYDFDAVMWIVDRLQETDRAAVTWRLAAARWCHACRWWPWVAAGLVFGWGMTVWGWITA